MILLKTGIRGHYFFIELLIALMFFSISGAVILRVFAAAHISSNRTVLRENAVLCAQSIAEAYSVSADYQTACKQVFGKASSNGTLFLDKSFSPTEKTPEVTLELSEERIPAPRGTLCKLSMTFSGEGSELYTLSCAAYYVGEGAQP